MSLVTIEVEIDHGRVIPRGAEALPERGTGLLTILPQSLANGVGRGSVSEFIEQWAGAFSAPEIGDDPRLEYLLNKHAK